MINSLKFDDIISNLEVMNKLYDIVRIVDPFNKEVLNYKEGKIEKEEERHCFGFWKTGEVCNNCISARAYNENETFVKIDYNGDKVFIVTSIPFDLSDRRIVVEMMKDITDKGIVDYLNGKSPVEIYKILGDKNIEAITDELTKTYNRRYINERIPYEIINAAVNKEHLTIILADIDFFKAVNDNYGHPCGDYVLQEFVQVIKNSIRNEVDFVARFGGEEFVIYLKNVNKEKSIEIAEKIRNNIETHEFVFEGKSLKITSSFGLYSIFNKEIQLEDLIKVADINLYEAKHTGRNKVVATE